MTTSNVSPIDEEVIFPASQQLVSTTDLMGTITYANEAFCHIAGYQRDELVGRPHNLVRHPDMPKAAFADLWQHLKAGQAWRGVVKNRCKDGRYYWVDAYVTPIYEHGKICGYQSVRCKPDDALKARAAAIYRQLRAAERGKASPSLARLRRPLVLPAILISLLYGIAIHGLAILPVLLLPLLLLGGLCYPELITTPRFLQQLTRRYDSFSRVVYAGTAPHAIAEFHQQLLQARINTILGRVDDTTLGLHQMANQLDQASADANHAMQRQDEQTHQIADAMQRFGEATGSVGEHIRGCVQQIDEVRGRSEQADHHLEQTRDAVNTLGEPAQQAFATAKALSEESRRIDDIMVEIRGIADQTNLLALNAAIESARAGEHGRGFAVVAGEVRNLSSRTQEATAQIQQRIAGIQQTLQQWQGMMQQNLQQTRHCSELTERGSAEVQQILGAMNHLQLNAAEIAGTMNEQEAVIEQICQSLQQVARHAEDNSERLLQVSNTSHELQQKAAQLAGLGHTFG
ncbi:methyl-accepting chemotaxis protein [Aeromonas simiae]|uniref:Methyl-accepting chemotaxis protein n=1 Tax=Aeromonas simiae TaxID=218936 RepID=A0A5J6WZP5_9GAMM|nr:PAS domain-containing methyl-accepting chemotaxis protein [Aeromonas simiae]QFI55223.1 methyl-accepting chemotaxis protein [Aeromonas simiae]